MCSGDMLRAAEGESHNRQDRIEAAVGDMQRAIYDIEVVMPMHAAPLVSNRRLRVVAHATGAGLVLTATQG